MSPPVDPRDPVATRSPSAGPCFLYVAPSAGEDLLKLGFSRGPLARLQSLHPRWFEVFDVDRTLLVETETVRDARRLELALRRQLVEHNAPAPLTVRRQAGGHTEWYRGAYATLAATVDELGQRGHVVHVPGRRWLQQALGAQSECLFPWTCAMLGVDGAGSDHLELAAVHGPALRAVRDALDACVALEVELESRVPEQVRRWHVAVARR
ncbi:MAG: GIY-YIG nuclease family protein [Pseudomonadota bacterium]|nr:GIY-YIG nuclease family protein [Pseudomonadota bacterium]